MEDVLDEIVSSEDLKVKTNFRGKMLSTILVLDDRRLRGYFAIWMTRNFCNIRHVILCICKFERNFQQS